MSDALPFIAMARAAARRAIRGRLSLEPLPRGGLLFGYARTDEEAILHGVKTLAAALEQL